MAGFSSHDDFLNEVTVNGKFWRADWNKLAHAAGAQTAGYWYCLDHSTGNPPAATLGAVGTNLAWHPLCDRITGGIYHGGDVSTDTKHVINAAAFSAAATTMPAVFMLCDLLGWYPVTTTTATGDQALINSKTFTADSGTDVLTIAATWDMQDYTAFTVSNSGGALPGGLLAATTYYAYRTGAGTIKACTSRAQVAATIAAAGASGFIDITSNGSGTNTIAMTVADRCPSNGVGVQAFITPSVALGAGTPNIRLTYTNASGTGSRLTPATLPVSTASAAIGHIEYSGTAAGKYGPFVPLAAADTGIQKVDQFNYSVTHTSGTTNVVLARPILTLPMTTIGVAAERDFLNQLPSLPRIYDGAHLAWLMYAGAATPANSAFYGHLDLGWG
jgi:hypothetical protein